jgi:hypothetical protein
VSKEKSERQNFLPHATYLVIRTHLIYGYTINLCQPTGRLVEFFIRILEKTTKLSGERSGDLLPEGLARSVYTMM